MTVALESSPPQPAAASPRLQRQAARGGAVVMITRLLTQVFNWSVTLFVARLLEPFDYGIMTAGAVLVGLADLVAEGGLGKALIQKKNLDPRDLAQAFTLNLIFALVLYGGLFLAAQPAANYLNTPEFTDFLRWLALVLLFIPFKAVPLAILERDLKLGKLSAIHVAATLVQSSLVLGAAWLGHGYWALLSGVIAARLVEALALTWMARWRPRLARPDAVSWGLLTFGLPATGASFLWFAYSNSDFAIVEALLGTTVLGVYAFAFQLISLPAQKLTANVNQVAFPVFCRLRNDPARLKNWFLRLTVLLGFFGLPALEGLILVAPDAFPLIFGQRWLEAVAPFQLLGGAGMVMIIATTFPPLFNALGRPGINLQYTAACTIVLPVCFLAGGSALGVVGVCLAWLLVYPAIVAILIRLTRHVTGINLLDLLLALAPVLGGLLAMAVAVLAIQGAWAEAHPWARLLWSCGGGALVYGGWMWWFGGKSVLRDVKALWHEIKGKSPQVVEPGLG